MTTKKLRFPILLLVLWLAAATLIPQSYAAGGAHRVEVKANSGYTSDAVGVNEWETGTARDVTFTPLDGYAIQTVSAVYGGQTANTAVKDKPAQLTAGGIVLPLDYEGRSVIVTIPGNCTGDLTLSASAETADCRIDVTADSGIEVSGGGSYGIGKAVTITAVPSGEAEITRVQVIASP